MAYDDELAERIRAMVGDDPSLSERRMFGGVAFLINGNMAVAASGQGGLLVRIDPTESETLLATTSAQPMRMRGRDMKGWLVVGGDLDETELARWVGIGTDYARRLPPKG